MRSSTSMRQGRSVPREATMGRRGADPDPERYGLRRASRAEIRRARSAGTHAARNAFAVLALFLTLVPTLSLLYERSGNLAAQLSLLRIVLKNVWPGRRTSGTGLASRATTTASEGPSVRSTWPSTVTWWLEAGCGELTRIWMEAGMTSGRTVS